MKTRFPVFCLLTIILLITACGVGAKRDISTPEKALLGHWMTRDGGMRVDYYFGDRTFVMTIGESRLDWSYNVLESDIKANTVTVEIEMGFTDAAGYKVPTGMVLQFSKNRKSISETSVGAEGRVTNKWTYMDSKTEP